MVQEINLPLEWPSCNQYGYIIHYHLHDNKFDHLNFVLDLVEELIAYYGNMQSQDQQNLLEQEEDPTRKMFLGLNIVSHSTGQSIFLPPQTLEIQPIHVLHVKPASVGKRKKWEACIWVRNKVHVQKVWSCSPPLMISHNITKKSITVQDRC